jgi:probable F420-dependent oxidoreductase
MQLAVSPTTSGLGVGDLAALCGFGESLGYRSAWLAEVSGPDPFVLATAIADRTTRMDVGVAVVSAFTRTPVAIATAAASVSQALGGRTFSLGIGSSSETMVDTWHGLSFHQPRLRVAETVAAVKAVLGGEPGFEGNLVRTSRFRLATPAVGELPVLVGALRPGLLRLAGEVADGVCLNLMPPSVVARQLQAVEEGRVAAGRSGPFEVMARLQVLVTEDVVSARQHLRQAFLGPYLAQPVYNRFLAWMGYEEEAAAIAAGWEARDREAVAKAIPDRLVDDLALLGPAAQVRSRLEEFAEAGITMAALSVPAPDRATVEDTLRRLAP